jgi:arylsulfatase A-like enzyme
MKTTRREFLKSVGMGTTALVAPNLFLNSCMKKIHPNIIFIMSDDHAERAISCYNDSLIQTPNIDRIASEGVRFQNSFVTNSICGPSRATLLTGKYSHLNGMLDHSCTFDGSQLTFPKLLQQAGYHTSIVGKWHLKTEPTGFDHWNILKGQGQYYNPEFTENGQKKTHEGYATDIITDLAIETLDTLDKSSPFCMLIHHKAPHRNWMPNLKHLDEFNDQEIPLPANFHDEYIGRIAAGEADMRIDDMYLTFDLKLHAASIEKETGSGGKQSFAEKVTETWESTYKRMTDEQRAVWDAHYDLVNEEFKRLKLKGAELLNWKYQHYLKDYLRCILSIDENVGRVLDYLDQNGLADNTLVVYTSDQGFYLGEHGWYDKRFMYEESLSMPLVMRYPEEIQPGQVADKMVMNLDFSPTFLDFAGIDIPAEIQGRSLRGMVRGRTPEDWRESIYYHYYEHPHGWHNVRRHYGVRTERYKLIHYYEDQGFWELFDLEKDPSEMNNVYSDPRYAKIVQETKQELVRLQKRYGDVKINQS